jgi:hypothetical protein
VSRSALWTPRVLGTLGVPFLTFDVVIEIARVSRAAWFTTLAAVFSYDPPVAVVRVW